MAEIDTLPKLIKATAEQRGARLAMAMKNFGVWQRFTWKDYYERIKYLSLGFISLGLNAGDRVCIIGDNEPEWFWAEFAVQATGGITTGIFVDSIPSEVKYIAEHSGAKFAIVNDQEQTDKFLSILQITNSNTFSCHLVLISLAYSILRSPYLITQRRSTIFRNMQVSY